MSGSHQALLTPCTVFLSHEPSSVIHLHTLFGSSRISRAHICYENTSRVSRSKGPRHTHTHREKYRGEEKNISLTQDSTLKMVCGCLANVIGSNVDPARPAPNDPTPSIFCRSVCALLAAPRSRLHGRMDALLLATGRDWSCALPEAREHSQADVRHLQTGEIGRLKDAQCAQFNVERWRGRRVSSNRLNKCIKIKDISCHIVTD